MILPRTGGYEDVTYLGYRLRVFTDKIVLYARDHAGTAEFRSMDAARGFVRYLRSLERETA